MSTLEESAEICKFQTEKTQPQTPRVRISKGLKTGPRESEECSQHDEIRPQHSDPPPLTHPPTHPHREAESTDLLKHSSQKQDENKSHNGEKKTQVGNKTNKETNPNAKSHGDGRPSVTAPSLETCGTFFPLAVGG